MVKQGRAGHLSLQLRTDARGGSQGLLTDPREIPRRFGLSVHIVILSLAGCGSDLATVQGVVTLDGDPLPDARIVFEAPDRPMAVGSSDEQGRYTMRTGSQKGIQPGSYAVAISAYQTLESRGAEAPMPVLRSPKKYNSASSSGLTAEIQQGYNGKVDFHLTTAP